MSQHHGEALEEFLRMRRINKGDAADKLGISRGTLYLWFNKKELADDSVLLSWKHTGIVSAHKSGIDIYSIMRQCRHGSINETQRYLKSLGLLPNVEFASKMK